jgi:hypothetical protein
MINCAILYSLTHVEARNRWNEKKQKRPNVLKSGKKASGDVISIDICGYI